MRNCDTDFLNALDALDALDAPEQPLTPGELDRLAAGVFARIDTACAPAAKASAAPAARPAPRRARRRAAAFAALRRRWVRPWWRCFPARSAFSPALRNKARPKTPWTRPAAAMTAMPQA